MTNSGSPKSTETEDEGEGKSDDDDARPGFKGSKALEAKEGGPYSLFVDNIPPDSTRKGFIEVFRKFSSVCGAFISRKHRRYSPNIFGFIRFWKREDVEVAVSKMNGVWLDGRKLSVYFPLYESPVSNPKRAGRKIPGVEGSFLQAKPKSKMGKEQMSSILSAVDLGNVSYSQVLSGAKPIFSSSLNRRDCKRISVSVSNTWWLSRCAVAFTRNFRILGNIFEVIAKEFKGVNTMRILGAHQLLIEFVSSSARDEFIVLGSWEELFFSINPWCMELVCAMRSVWLELSGLPIHSWSIATLSEIANIWGSLLGVDEGTLNLHNFTEAFICVSSKETVFDKFIEVMVADQVFVVNIKEVEAPGIVESEVCAFTEVDVLNSGLCKGLEGSLSHNHGFGRGLDNSSRAMVPVDPGFEHQNVKNSYLVLGDRKSEGHGFYCSREIGELKPCRQQEEIYEALAVKQSGVQLAQELDCVMTSTRTDREVSAELQGMDIQAEVIISRATSVCAALSISFQAEEEGRWQHKVTLLEVNSDGGLDGMETSIADGWAGDDHKQSENGYFSEGAGMPGGAHVEVGANLKDGNAGKEDSMFSYNEVKEGSNVGFSDDVLQIESVCNDKEGDISASCRGNFWPDNLLASKRYHIISMSNFEELSTALIEGVSEAFEMGESVGINVPFEFQALIKAVM